jgi:hypothetical protein
MRYLMGKDGRERRALRGLSSLKLGWAEFGLGFGFMDAALTCVRKYCFPIVPCIR